MVANLLLALRAINLIMLMLLYCCTPRSTPLNYYSKLQAIENNAGRVRLERWGARSLDLDILLYENQQINTPDLIIPHKELVNRCFVVLPLLDINPTLTLPNSVKVANLACASLSDDIHVLADNNWY
jgi:2-amino-4-hydroxy-6-hydroxymethyldihydropteridine diphosphokinase